MADQDGELELLGMALAEHYNNAGFLTNGGWLHCLLFTATDCSFGLAVTAHRTPRNTIQLLVGLYACHEITLSDPTSLDQAIAFIDKHIARHVRHETAV